MDTAVSTKPSTQRELEDLFGQEYGSDQEKSKAIISFFENKIGARADAELTADQIEIIKTADLARDEEGKSAAHFLVKSWNGASSGLFKHLNLQVQDLQGRTSLQEAIEAENYDVLPYLLVDGGANPRIEDKNGRNMVYSLINELKTKFSHQEFQNIKSGNDESDQERNIGTIVRIIRQFVDNKQNPVVKDDHIARAYAGIVKSKPENDGFESAILNIARNNKIEDADISAIRSAQESNRSASPSSATGTRRDAAVTVTPLKDPSPLSQSQ